MQLLHHIIESRLPNRSIVDDGVIEEDPIKIERGHELRHFIVHGGRRGGVVPVKVQPS